MKRFLYLLTLATLPLSLGACSKKVPECNAIVDIINPAADKLNGIDLENEDDPVKMAKKLSDSEKAAASASESLGALGVTTDELKSIVIKFQGALDTIASESKTASESVLEMKEKQTEAESLQKVVENAIGKLEIQCEKDVKICETIGALFESASEDASGMRTTAGSLSALSPKNPELKKTITELSKSFARLADILEDAEKFKNAMESTVKKIDASIDTQNETVDEMDKFCTGD